MSAAGKAIRWAVRLALLAAAVLLALGGPLPALLTKAVPGLKPAAIVRAVPGLSPLVAAASVVSQRRWYLAAAWAAAALVVLGVAVWKGRLFCRWVCPAGTLYSLPARLSLKRPLLKVRLGPLVFWTVVFASLAGAPLVLFLDPLATFHRLTPLLRGTWTAASVVAGVLLPLMLLIGFIQPMLWCTHLCPLGYFFELAQALRKRPLHTFSSTRRSIVGGLLVGAPLAALARHLPAARRLLLAGEKPPLPVLPPGAADPATFAAACTRCYACVNVCPARIIRVPMPLGRALGQLFQPEIEYYQNDDEPDWGYCPEWCNECSGVCPTGALAALSFDQKHQRQIGLAEVVKKACLAWEDKQDCSVCQEVCPYQAVELRLDEQSGVACPVVMEDLCRGCGACQSKCPAIRMGKAIVVRGVAEQIDVRCRGRRKQRGGASGKGTGGGKGMGKGLGKGLGKGRGGRGAAPRGAMRHAKC